MIEVVVRQATTEADVKFIAEHFEETVALWEDYKITQESIVKRNRMISEWIAADHTHFTVALTQAGKIVGFNSLWITEGNDGKKCGKICILYVLPDYRGQGIAHQMKLEGEAWLRSRGIEYVLTEIDAKNNRMFDISKKAGFTIKSYVMIKKL